MCNSFTKNVFSKLKSFFNKIHIGCSSYDYKFLRISIYLHFIDFIYCKLLYFFIHFLIAHTSYTRIIWNLESWNFENILEIPKAIRYNLYNFLPLGEPLENFDFYSLAHCSYIWILYRNKISWELDMFLPYLTEFYF